MSDQTLRYFTVAERLRQLPVASDEQCLSASWAPASPLLEELRLPLWWTPTRIAVAVQS